MAPPESDRGSDRERLMKIFHLFANHKFTGPADLAMVMASGQQHAGADVCFISSTHPKVENTVEQMAASRGLKTRTGLRLGKHLQPVSLYSDVNRLGRWIDEEKPDFLHCHLDGDHLLACICATRAPVRVIRSSYQLDPPTGWRGSWLARHTYLWLPPTVEAERCLIARHPAAGGKTRVTAPAVDLERFQPAAVDAKRGLDAPIVIGVVARMQRHRRFPDLIEAFATAAAREPRLRLEILGRGTHQDEVARAPAARTGLGDRIRFGGYVDPESYPQHLSSFDMLVFLVPGSDGTCRAAREALSCGVPVIASRRGLLPELIPANSGILLQNEATETLSEAMLGLARDPHRRQQMARNAREHAIETFDAGVLATTLVSELTDVIGPGDGPILQNR
ncbi:MAG: hypothetical protein DSY81_07940 [Bacillota bacterium]|nr:MAG: hypothetical protein DSY81_07940 [Bacillota bacterium]